MRPDEHKRKKNAVYKKKHGISNNKDDNKPSSGDISRSTAVNDKKSKREHNVNRTASSHNLKKIPKAAEASVYSDSSGSDQETEVVEKKSFRRREIVSNWRKYELEPENDETIKSRGEDFEKLLNMAGEAMSRFRFKDELEWEEEEGKLGDGYNAVSDLPGSDVLSLDLANIGTSMSCIPIHDLLGIDPNLFPSDQLESHIHTATEKRNFYNKTLRQEQEQSESASRNISKDLLNSSPNDFEDTSVSAHDQAQHKVSQAIDKQIILEANINIEPSKNDKPSDHRSIELTKESKASSGDTVKKIANKELPQNSEPSISLEDDDLDQLLDMDVRREHVVGAGKQGPIDISMKRESDNTKGHSIPKKAAEKEADELEDWLDSILD